MKRADPHLVGDWSDQRRDAITHFFGRFVGKRDGQNVHRVRALRNQIGDALRKHPRFTRAGASDYKERPTWVQYRILLIWIETRDTEGRVNRTLRHNLCALNYAHWQLARPAHLTDAPGNCARVGECKLWKPVDEHIHGDAQLEASQVRAQTAVNA